MKAVTKPPANVPVVIFDFDGTLADTFVMSVRIFERMTKRSEPYNEEEIMHLRGFSAFHLVRELHIRPWKVPWMLARGRAQMKREIDTIKVFDGIPEVLEQLRAAGIPMYIMSSNSPGNIRKLLHAKGLDGYFERVYGNVGIFGKSKMLRRVVGRNRINPATAYYVGDEGRDTEAAKRVGLHSVAVTWGYNSEELLRGHGPETIVHTPAELAATLIGS
jgi:phosphoglycolate phosphatase